QGGSCPTIEVAPGVFIPICPNALPKPPPGFTFPEAVLPPPSVFVPSVDLRVQGLDGPVKSQEQTGVCYAFALSDALENSLRRQGRRDVLSPLHIIASGVWHDMWRSQPSEVIGTESAWPYDPIKACKFKEPGSDTCEQAYGVSTNSWRSDPVLSSE